DVLKRGGDRNLKALSFDPSQPPLSSYPDMKLSDWQCKVFWAMLTAWVQSTAARIFRLRTQFFLDAQQLIVFRGPIGTGERAGFDLPAIGGDREIGNGCVLCFTGSV